MRYTFFYIFIFSSQQYSNRQVRVSFNGTFLDIFIMLEKIIIFASIFTT